MQGAGAGMCQGRRCPQRTWIWGSAMRVPRRRTVTAAASLATVPATNRGGRPSAHRPWTQGWRAWRVSQPRQQRRPNAGIASRCVEIGDRRASDTAQHGGSAAPQHQRSTTSRAASTAEVAAQQRGTCRDGWRAAGWTTGSCSRWLAGGRRRNNGTAGAGGARACRQSRTTCLSASTVWRSCQLVAVRAASIWSSSALSS